MQEYLHKRVLLGGNFLQAGIEGVITEISPSGERFKFEETSGVTKMWRHCSEYCVLEVLP